MPPVQFGFILPQVPRDPVQRANFMGDLNRALAHISGHFDSFRIIDHLMNNVAGDDIESFTTLAYLSALHPQLKFGHTVICQSFRSPALVAKMGATLQVLSGGRFLFGIGAGGDASEHRAYGYDFPAARMRVEQLEEALQIIRGMWTQEKTSFVGKYYQVHEARCEPKPDPMPPVTVGAFKPKMLRLAARYADEWNVSSTGIGEYRRLLAEFERACAEVGRESATVRRSWSGGCVCVLDSLDASRIAGERYGSDPDGEFDFVGTPHQVVDQLAPFIEWGVSSFLVDCGGFPDLTTLDLLICEVMPAFNR